MADNSIVNLGEISKPATVLIEKISEAVGGIFKPCQIVRVAKAEAEADRIRAESQIEISDLQRRAMHRFLEEEAIKQKNMEDITQQALPQINEDAPSENVENDWITHFFDKCRLISNSDMQLLWSSVLAGEANAPGTYSKRTIDLLSSMDKNDALIFTKLRALCWMYNELIPLIYDIQDDTYNKHGINTRSLIHLDSIGLIRYSSFTGFRKIDLPNKIVMSYHDEKTLLEFKKDSGNEINLGCVVLTKAGQELANVCKTQPNAEFVNHVHDLWKSWGYKVSSL